jgi:outer membrane protein assembly factor BamB
MGRHAQRLVIGVGGHAVSVDPSTGTERWRTKLKGTGFVTLTQADDKVFAGANGELFCLDEATGRILWHNKLKGLGFGVVAFSGSGELVAAAAEAAARRAATGAATT